MAKFDKYTKLFLLEHPDLAIGQSGLDALSEYIDSGFNKMDFSKMDPDTINKLEILSQMIELGDFGKNKKGEFKLTNEAQMKFRDDYEKNKSKKTLPRGAIALPWVKVLASLPMKETDWLKVPNEDKQRLAAALDSRIKRVFDFNRLRAEGGLPQVGTSEYLRLAVGDLSIVRNDFCEFVYNSFREMKDTSLFQTHPREVMGLVLASAEKQAREISRMHSADKTRETFVNSEKKVPIEFLKIWRDIKQTKAKSPSQWQSELASQKVGKDRKTTSLDYVERIALKALEGNYELYGIDTGLKYVKFSDPYLARRTKEDPQAMKLVESVYKKQLLKSFFDYLWVMKKTPKPTPEDFYHAAQFAQTKAAEKLHDSLPRIKQIMVKAEEQLKREIRMVRLPEGKKKQMVA